jgi:lipopolysaccharide export system permease protein
LTLISRYILSTFGRFFGLALAAFIGLYLLVDFFERVDNFIEYGAAAHLYLSYFALKIPLISIQVVPLACLLAVFMTLGGFSRSNELTAMHSAGISLLRVTLPLLATALLISLLTLLTYEYLVPICVKRANLIYTNKVQGRPVAAFKRNRIWLRDGSKIVNIRLAEAEKGQLQGVTLFDFDQHFKLTDRSDIPQASYVNGQWRAESLIERRFGNGNLIASHTAIDRAVDLNLTPEDFRVSGSKRNEDLGYRELRSLAAKLKAEGYDPTRFQVDMHARLATPFASLIMAFLGIPFALRKGRESGLALGVAMSVMIGVVYFILQAMLLAFGYSAALPPILAAWAANALFFLFGCWLFLGSDS